MKETIDTYYKKLTAASRLLFGTPPAVPWREDLNPALLTGEPDEDEEVPWAPIDQTEPVDWAPLERELGFALGEELRAYYGTCFFMDLRGRFGAADLDFYGVDGSKPVTAMAKLAFQDGQYVFPDTQIFLIGWAAIGEDDSYFIFFDNQSGKLFCFDPEMKREVLLSYSIRKTIGAMEALA